MRKQDMGKVMRVRGFTPFPDHVRFNIKNGTLRNNMFCTIMLLKTLRFPPFFGSTFAPAPGR